MPGTGQTGPPTPDPQRRGLTGGFTLIELVAVLVILSIIAISAIPVLASLDDTRGGMAARELVRDLTYARQRAVATGTRTWVQFDTAAETWTVLAEDPTNPGKANASVITDPGTGTPFVKTLATGSFAGVELVSAAFTGGADNDLGFDWLGRPLDKNETLLTSQGAAQVSGGHQVTIEAVTGHIAYVAP